MLALLSVLALGGGVFLIAAAIALRTPTTVPTTALGPSGAPAAAAGSDLPSDGYTLGQADAAVTIDLFEDFQCPACRNWGSVVFPSLAANELADGRAKLVFHDLPFIGPESFDAARAGQAAAAQNRFWDLWATIYANQGAENSGALTPARLTAMARSIGLDMDRFAADVDPAVTDPAIAASIAVAARAEIQSTPTLIVGGRVLVAASYADLSAAIADAAGD